MWGASSRVWGASSNHGEPALGSPGTGWVHSRSCPGRDPCACRHPHPFPSPTCCEGGGRLRALVAQVAQGRQGALQTCWALVGSRAGTGLSLSWEWAAQGRCPLKRLGGTSRTCLVTPVSPGWPGQFSNPFPDTQGFDSAPGPKTATGAASPLRDLGKSTWELQENGE